MCNEMTRELLSVLLKWLCHGGLTPAIAAISLFPIRAAENISAGQTAVTTVGLSPDEAQADFDFMLRVLEEAHPGLYRYSTKAQLDGGFADQRAKLGHPMVKAEYFEVFAETLALIRCGHTSINPDDEMMKRFKTARLFPLQVMLEGPHMIVKSNETPDDQTIVPGTEILEINGHRVPDILDRCQKIESGDGDIETGKWVHIQRGFAMYYWVLNRPSVYLHLESQRCNRRELRGETRGRTR